MSTVAEVLSGSAQWVVLKAECAGVLAAMADRSVHHVIGDPPFSPRVHEGQVRQDGDGGVAAADLGFPALTPILRQTVAVACARVATRWTVLKSDLEGTNAWLDDLAAAGCRWTRFGAWWKDGAQPQFTGDRPAVGLEGFAIAHSTGERMRWNGGGKHARWVHPIARGARIHPTETPLSLWLEIVEDFTDPGEVVLDPFCGGGSLGLACLRARGGPRRYIGMDNGADENGKPWAEWAREGLSAEEQGLSRGAAKAGQMPLLSLAPSRRQR